MRIKSELRGNAKCMPDRSQHTQTPTDTQMGKVQLDQILPVGCLALQRLPGCLEATGLLSYGQAVLEFPSTCLERSLRSHLRAWHPDQHIIYILSPGQRDARLNWFLCTKHIHWGKTAPPGGQHWFSTGLKDVNSTLKNTCRVLQ